MPQRVTKPYGGTGQDNTNKINVHATTNRVAIGANRNPEANLHVFGNLHVSGSVSYGGAVSANLYVNTHVGINTTSPTRVLDIRDPGTGGAGIYIRDTVGSNSNARANITFASGNNATIAQVGLMGPGFTTEDFYVRTLTGNVGIRLSPGGNTSLYGSPTTGNWGVGRGFDTPAANLHVFGNVIVRDNVTVGTKTLYANPINERVGVGTVSPAANLHVFGNVAVTGNVHVGDIRGLSYTTFGYSSAYSVLMVGDPYTATRSLSLGFDPKHITTGQFTGRGEVILGNAAVIAPSWDNTQFIRVLQASTTANAIMCGGYYTDVIAADPSLVIFSESQTTMPINKRVMIGGYSANPKANLTVLGNAYVSTDLTTGNSAFFANSQFGTVGIGITPSTNYSIPLIVRKDANGTVQSYFINYNTASEAGVDIIQGNSVTYTTRYVRPSSAYLHEHGTGILTRYSDFNDHNFRVTGGTSFVKFQGATRGVGLGTDSPVANLHVVGNTYVVSDITTGGKLLSTGVAGFGNTNPSTSFRATFADTGDAHLVFTNATGVVKSYIGTSGAFTTGLDDLRIRSDGSNIVFGFSGTETFKLTSAKTINHNNSNVVVDAASNIPVTRLNSGASASATTFWRGDGTWATTAGAGASNWEEVAGGAGPLYPVNVYARVGLGTTSPVANLHVVGNLFIGTGTAAGSNAHLVLGNAQGTVQINVYPSTSYVHERGAGVIVTKYTEYDNHYFGHQNATDFIKFEGSTRRVGIGTITPVANLHVVGNVYFTNGLDVSSNVIVGSTPAANTSSFILGIKTTDDAWRFGVTQRHVGGSHFEYSIGTKGTWEYPHTAFFREGKIGLGSNVIPVANLTVWGNTALQGAINQFSNVVVDGAGNIPVARHNSAYQAGTATFWRGDGAWVRTGLTPLANLNASASAALDFTAMDSSNYSAYLCVLENMSPELNSVSLYYRVSIDGGSTYLVGAAYIHARDVGDSSTAVGAAGSTSDSVITILSGVSNSLAAHGFSGYAIINSGGAIRGATKITWTGGAITASSLASSVNGYGYNDTTSEVNAFRFLMSSGNIASGRIRIYGIGR